MLHSINTTVKTKSNHKDNCINHLKKNWLTALKAGSFTMWQPDAEKIFE